MTVSNATANVDNSFYEGFRTSLEYSTMVRIISALIPPTTVILYFLLKGSMRAARRGDVICGRDITFRGGPDDLFWEMWILIKSRNWSKVTRGSFHAFFLIWISLLPPLLLQFGSWNRVVCLSNVMIIDTEDETNNDWFKASTFNKEQKARLALTFRQTFGIGMSTNATGTLKLDSAGKSVPISSSEVYSFRQCFYWTGETYNACESSQEIRESFDSIIRVVPTNWTTIDQRNRSLERRPFPYTQRISYYEQQEPGAGSSIRCANTFESKAWVCSFKLNNAWHIANLPVAELAPDGHLVDVPTLKLEGSSMEEGEWALYATSLASEIVGGGVTLTNVNIAQQLAMLYARFDYMLHGLKQTCKLTQKESFVASYLWMGILAVTTMLVLIAVWSIFKHTNSVHVPMQSIEWYMYGARMQCAIEGEEKDGSRYLKAPNITFYHKKFGLSKGNGSVQQLSWNEELHKNQGEQIIGFGSIQTSQNPIMPSEQENVNVDSRG